MSIIQKTCHIRCGGYILCHICKTGRITTSIRYLIYTQYLIGMITKIIVIICDLQEKIK